MLQKLGLKSLISLFFYLSFISNIMAFEKSKYAILVVDQNNGKILYEENADQYRHPASITKVMTLYLTFEAISQGKLNINSYTTVSRHAASMPRTNLDLKPGSKILIKDAIEAAALRSANDAAVILAEAISGSEKDFIQLMNERAKMLGMKQTHFTNASGLPDKNNKSSAYDIARLAIAIQRDYPEFYKIFSKKEFKYNGKVYKSTNNLLSKYNFDGVTGLKTGFTNMSGFNLVTTAKHKDRKIVAVVLGGPTSHARDRKMISLLDKYLGLAPKDYNIASFSKTTVKKKRSLKTKSSKQYALYRQSQKRFDLVQK